MSSHSRKIAFLRVTIALSVALATFDFKLISRDVFGPELKRASL